MKIIEAALKDVFVIDLEPIGDDRGFFARGWCQKEFQEHGLNASIVQQNFGYNKTRGTLRGLHFQTSPYSEVKIVRCVRGAIFDVAVDLRPESKNYKKWFGIELSAENHRMLYMPEGFAHGYQTLEDDTEMYYFTTKFYAPDNSAGARYNDSEFDIQWPLDVSEISENDKNWPLTLKK